MIKWIGVRSTNYLYSNILLFLHVAFGISELQVHGCRHILPGWDRMERSMQKLEKDTRKVYLYLYCNGRKLSL